MLWTQRTPPPASGENRKDVLFIASPGSPAEAVGRGESDDLGERVIDGFTVKGTRLTTIIGQNKIGNAKPITAITEDWYSPELKMSVLTVHTDPWAGRIETRLKDLVPGEPDPSLFKVPADSKLIDGEASGPFEIQIEGPPSK